ncbi:CoB--CoM heterodisulfide reductase iron-sulfur subunit B family protein [Candidatus Desulforudis audaxviator]|uniref:CoB--CoM heterodisulfide reductase n=1 Tax=Desulforudis audaxviator (strain MP104C) TaxID=477974 RepID=B1I5S6_DESAP|nr:CoB--CoM heterodisulfide reductase iron-sulfur subunit B family protein [Candidatus Desulforudis audaxviator]ACA60374.1 CoB--CoM heterodisulfide reductase [Candidatus Desulforudis audaxviator MP104C]AZK60428.1 CoB--CoM heterodisulfide reductase subunit B [Candidatus Desulforudis audaxviator]
MAYIYYPGCASEATGKSNHISFEAVAHALGLELAGEIPDWNCCGATLVANAIGDFAQMALACRNLALAEKKGHDIIVACSSCYLNLAWPNELMRTNPDFAAKLNEALGAANLSYSGKLKVKHVVDVLANEIGAERIKERTIKPLEGLKVACYSGCQTVRALRRPDFDDVEYPQVMGRIVEAVGAEAVDFPLAARCCGGSQQFTNPELIYDLTGKVLDSAAAAGADVIVTTCPMCAMNTDVFQEKIGKLNKKKYNMPVLFLTQLMGVAFDLKPKDLAFQYNIVSPYGKLKKYGVKK